MNFFDAIRAGWIDRAPREPTQREDHARRRVENMQRQSPAALKKLTELDAAERAAHSAYEQSPSDETEAAHTRALEALRAHQAWMRPVLDERPRAERLKAMAEDRAYVESELASATAIVNRPVTLSPEMLAKVACALDTLLEAKDFLDAEQLRTNAAAARAHECEVHLGKPAIGPVVPRVDSAAIGQIARVLVAVAPTEEAVSRVLYMLRDVSLTVGFGDPPVKVSDADRDLVKRALKGRR